MWLWDGGLPGWAPSGTRLGWRERMDGLIQDVRYGLRSLVRRPGFALVALLTLAVGIGANAAIFTMVDALLLRPLPFGDRSERVVSVHSTHRTQAQDWDNSRLSFADLEDMARSRRTLENVGGYVPRAFTLAVEDDAARVRGGSITPNLFPLLRAQPAQGRQFLPEEGQVPGFEQVVLLSHRLWQRRFGGAPGIVGTQVRVNQRLLTVVGVMPDGFRFPERDELWLPYRQDDAPRDRRFVAAVGVLPGGGHAGAAPAGARRGGRRPGAAAARHPLRRRVRRPLGPAGDGRPASGRRARREHPARAPRRPHHTGRGPALRLSDGSPGATSRISPPARG